MKWIRLVTFDATGTLIRPRGSISDQYAAACRRYGLKPDTQKIRDNFMKHWKRMSDEQPCFGLPARSSRDWWSELVKSTIVDSGCSHEDVERVFEPVFNDLFTDYCKKELWDIDPDAHMVLRDLTNKGVRVAIVSNFDERLPQIVEDIGIHKYFRQTKESPSMITSSVEIGYEKPHRKIFHSALQKIQNMYPHDNINPENCIHVGDHINKDVTGALQYGFNACYYNTEKPEHYTTNIGEYCTINKLGQLLKVVDILNNMHPI
eukprot:TRINITY_DN8981_c0_g1_i2.p1 TRINITY_DN8981_c0_g1~~TRINITY_DN8981_c0_g1_i2.p1  ORF type:complete len:262 (-),score=45.26 TRINITY_DN8981_c0_g1_i2:52-837(-)